MSNKIELSVGSRTLSIETGKVARQAGGSVLVTSGDTVVLATATLSDQIRENIDFFPLTCDYEERKYAVGKIPGGFVKRGGRPSEKAILTSRLIDRPLRPLFPSGMRNDVQVIAMPLSYDPENPADVLAMVGASAALTISDVPFGGPIGAVRVARIDGEFIINPSLEQQEASELDLVVAGTSKSVSMIEAGAKFVAEDVIMDAIEFAHEAIKELCRAQEELAGKAGKPKREVILHEIDETLLDTVRSRFSEEIEAAVVNPDKASRESAIQELKLDIVERLAEDFPDREVEVAEAAEKVIKERIRKLILDEKKRPDGRKPDEIRQISSEVGLLPRVHGSGLFTRGQTQVLTTLTLGSLDDAQIVDTLEEDGEKRYMHFYNFPPYSVGETRQLRGPGRRDIGHGALAERALRPVIPAQEEFPYTLLLQSEVLESNGSSSMASVCGSTLALMDAGVRISAPVAGIAMGLITDGDRYELLTDIQGMEDFSGDMDFKSAGTREGITALQLDTKIEGVPMEVLRRGLAQAREARLHILDKMQAAIAEPRDNLSKYAPRVFIVLIHPDKIGDIIGPGGKIIKKIEAETGASLDIEQDGHVYITSVDAEGGERAKKWVEDLTKEARVGETYVGKVTRVERYGAFVEIIPGKDGLVHISEMGPGRTERTEDVVRLGDEVMVKVIGIDEEGKVRLTMKVTGEATPGQPPPQRERGGAQGREHGPEERGRRDRYQEDKGEPVKARFRPKR